MVLGGRRELEKLKNDIIAKKKELKDAGMVTNVAIASPSPGSC